jgi:hypothetical protein
MYCKCGMMSIVQISWRKGYIMHEVYNKSYTTCTSTGAGTSTLPEHLSSPSVLVGFVLINLHFSVYYFVDHYCLSSWPVFLWLLCYLSFFDLRLLINLLVSSSFSCSCFIYIIFWHFRGLFWHINMALTILSIHIGNDIVQYTIKELILTHLYLPPQMRLY